MAEKQITQQLVYGAASASLSLSDVPINGKAKSGNERFTINMLIDTITFVLAGSCVVLSILAMANTSDGWSKNIKFTAFTISIFMSFWVIVQRIILIKSPVIRDIINDLQEECKCLEVENNRLGTEVSALERETEKLSQLESQLAEICTSQGQNMKKFSSLVKENGNLLKQIKEQMKAEAMEGLMTVVLRADRDESFSIEPKEVPGLIMRLENQTGVKIDKKKFQEALQRCGYQLDGIIELVKDIADDGKAVFTITPKNDLPALHKIST